MTVKPYYTMKDNAAMEDVKEGSNDAVNREDIPPSVCVCVSLQVT